MLAFFLREGVAFRRPFLEGVGWREAIVAEMGGEAVEDGGGRVLVDHAPHPGVAHVGEEVLEGGELGPVGASLVAEIEHHATSSRSRRRPASRNGIGGPHTVQPHGIVHGLPSTSQQPIWSSAGHTGATRLSSIWDARAGS